MDKVKVKESCYEGLRVGLIAFLITFAISLVLSVLVNVFLLQSINRLVNGAFITSTMTGSSILTLTSAIINMSLFNSGGTLSNGGTLHMGIVFFSLLPVLSFIIADRRDNKKKSFDLHDMIIYVTSSTGFAVSVYVFSLITKGEFVQITFDYTTIRNLFMTIIITMTMQLLIGLNYNKSFSAGIRITRRLFRIIIGLGVVIGLVGIVFVLNKYLGGSVPFVAILLMAIIMIPNISVYFLFTFFGASLQLGDQLHTLVYEYFEIDLGFAGLPLAVRIFFVIAFFIVVLFNLYKLEEKDFVQQVVLFGASFSFLSLVLSYCTQMNLGIVRGFIGVSFGYSNWYVFFTPLIIIALAGGLVLALRNLKKEIEK